MAWASLLRWGVGKDADAMVEGNLQKGEFQLQ